MSCRTVLTAILAIVLGPWASFAQAEKLPMPPVFTPAAPIEQTLRAYPLGVITKQAAFSHHGTAHREITLPDGLEGWVYDVGGVPKAVTYVSPGGKQQTVRETPRSHEARSYTLVFDNRGVVVDVLYNETGPHDGLTALSLQHRKGVLRTEEHAHPGPRQ
jgi:hypothetical protein